MFYSQLSFLDKIRAKCLSQHKCYYDAQYGKKSFISAVEICLKIYQLFKAFLESGVLCTFDIG